jgi:GNAT superfamily N-acetyltransferase
MPSHRIRPASPDDAEILAADRVSLFVQTDPNLTPFEADRLRDDTIRVLRSGLTDRTMLGWVAQDSDGTWLGSAVICLVRRLPTVTNRTGTEAYLAQMFVAEGGRGKGLGKALLAATLEASRRLGISHMRLRTTVAGRPLYQATGFADLPDFMERRVEVDES